MAPADDGVKIVVVENLHWIDEDTQAVLDDIVDAAHGAALHLVVTYRPEYIDRWTDRPHHALITLAPLAGSAAVQLVGDLLGDDSSVGTLRHAPLLRTGGTPLFLEETVRALAECGTLVGDRGTYRYVGDGDACALPDTVQAVVSARVDRRSPDDKHMLQVAAVIGETVPVDVLATTSGLATDLLATSTDRLRTAEFVYDLATQDALTFKPNLIREVVYGEIPRDRRRLLHGAIADALDDDADPPLERLAHHTYSAERWERPCTGCGAPRSGPSSGRPTRRPSGSRRWAWTRPRASATHRSTWSGASTWPARCGRQPPDRAAAASPAGTPPRR